MKVYQRGSALIVAIIVASVLGLVAVFAAISYISAFNYGNQAEKQLSATMTNNRNILSQYGQKLQEVAQVPEMYKNDLVEVAKAAIQGRYGANGSQATMQWLKEQNPSLDVSIYKKVQQIVESGRNDFERNQTKLIDQKRVYETALGSFWQGMWLRIAGYPKINLDDIKIVSTDRADEAFKTGKESGPINLRPKAKE